jgi:hypothetical protein
MGATPTLNTTAPPGHEHGIATSEYCVTFSISIEKT